MWMEYLRDSSFEEDLILILDGNTGIFWVSTWSCWHSSGGSGWVEAELCITTEYFTFFTEKPHQALNKTNPELALAILLWRWMLEFTGTNCSAVPPIILSGEGGWKRSVQGQKMNYLDVVFDVFMCFMKTALCISVSTARSAWRHVWFKGGVGLCSLSIY